MIKLYFKTVVLTLLLLAFSLTSYFYGYSFIQKKRLRHTDLVLNQGSFAALNQLLANTPKASWTTAIKTIQQQLHYPIFITAIDQIKLSDKQRQHLLIGDIIYTSGQNWLFLNYGDRERTAYQRIGNSNLALAINAELPILSSLKDSTTLMRYLISLNLKSQSLEQIAALYNIPMQLKSIDALPKQIQQQIQRFGVGFEKPKHSHQINTFYTTLPDTVKILAIGPIQYSNALESSEQGQFYYFMCFLAFAIIVVCLLTWAFSRNIRKLYVMTQNYGKGRFDSSVKISPLSVLHSTYQNIKRMGEQIDQSIKTQTNMARFIAHELRTPLYTMQLTLDDLKDKHLENTSSHVASLYDDLNSLNELVIQFLLFSRASNHELTLKKEATDLNQWLQQCLNRFSATGISIIFRAAPQPINCEIDPKLLQHAISNLITNALKHCNTEVQLSALSSDTSVMIHVDDDGPGINANKRQHIFKAFTTLNNDTALNQHIGLGLAIAQSIVQLHNGVISINSSPKGGARFTITLPL